MKSLRQLVNVSLVHYLRIMGALTGLLGALLAIFPVLGPAGLKVVHAALFLPPTAETNISGTSLDYSPLIQHWGLLLALVGFFMVAASREGKTHWVVPAMAISGIEKLFVVYFSWIAYPGGFVTDAGVVVDFLGTLYSLLFFATLSGKSE